MPEIEEKSAASSDAAERGITRRLLVAVVAFGLVYAVLVVGFGALVVRRVTSIIERNVAAEARLTVQRVASELERPTGRRGMRLGEEKQAELLRPIREAVSRNELLLSVRLVDSTGRTIDYAPPRPDDPRLSAESGPPERVVVDLRGGGVLVAELSRAAIDRRTAFVRAELVNVVAFILVLGGLILTGAVLYIWKTSALGHRVLGERIQQARLAEVGALAAGLAHEIRNPLNSLRLNIQLIEEDVREQSADPGAGERLRLLGLTRREIRRLERLLEDFLRYARPRPPERRDTDLVALCRSVVGSLGAELGEESIQVEFDAPLPPPHAPIDPGQVTQVLVNLLRNAREALLAKPLADRRIRIEIANERAEWVRIALVDSGPGVDVAELPRLGSLFYSTKKGGTGLGLAIARRVCEEHGGEIRFESAPGHGLRVVLRFPRQVPTT